MPFTFAHPAIVLPLAKVGKRYISLTGLVAGSLAPDFEYFFRMKPQSEYSHTLAGIFSFNLPVAIIISFLFHLFIRNPLINHLPDSLYYRFHPYKCFSWLEHVKKFYPAVIVSIIIGAFSHIFWDSFTHEAGFGVKIMPLLTNRIDGVPFFRIVQHLSTVFGFAVIAFAVLKMKVKESLPPPSHRDVSVYWTMVFFITLTVGSFLIGGFINLFRYVPARGIMVVSFINSFLLGLFLASVKVSGLNRKFK